jgi:hypothetical protein
VVASHLDDLTFDRRCHLLRAVVGFRARVDEARETMCCVTPQPLVHGLTTHLVATGNIGHRRAVEHLFHRLQALFHDAELHEHEGLLRVLRVNSLSEEGGEGEVADLRRDERVRQVPEPLSPRPRTRVLQVPTSYRSHGVKHEPESHIAFSVEGCRRLSTNRRSSFMAI